MPEIKHTFQGGKMNKDLDERIVRNGEYSHAINVQVATTDNLSESGESSSAAQGAAGAIQNIQGNRDVGSAYYANWMDNSIPVSLQEYAVYGNSQKPKCVGSIGNERTNKSYFFFASPIYAPISDVAQPDDVNKRIYVDSIIEQDQNNITTPVVIDKFAVIDSLYYATPGIAQESKWQGDWDRIIVENGSDYKVGMEIKILLYGSNILLNDETSTPTKIKAIFGNILLLDGIQLVNPISEARSILEANNPSATFSSAYISKSLWFVAESPRVLNFSQASPSITPSQADKPITITGINIIDNLLFWTDSHSEPKKINIDRCKAGTDIYNQNDLTTHTKLYVENKEGDLVDAASVSYMLDSSDISEATGLQLSGGGVNSDLKEEHITVIREAPRKAPSLKMSSGRNIFEAPNGSSATFLTINTSLISGSTDTLSVGQTKSIIDTDLINSRFVKDDILKFTRDDGSVDNPLSFLVKFICYENEASGDEVFQQTQRIRVQIISSAALQADDTTWKIELDKKKPLFELKLARFGYRYKYEDGEYSSFSPWSEVAFLPDLFEYSAGSAYNLGMVNTVRELTVNNFIPYTIPLDVKEVDILYKSTDSANAYVVDTVKKNIDAEWEFFTPDGDSNTIEIKTGELTITSEIIHRTLESNQLLRAWDNVPRTAYTQEVVGNRLLYGNYTQGYDINDTINLTQSIVSEKVVYPNPKKSIKTLRDYKIGMVFGDKYGRETPVITPGYLTIDTSDAGASSYTGDISLSKTLCARSNSFIVSQTWGDPNTSDAVPPLSINDGWIDYVKYYIKETSTEYYNLIMDRWYLSGDNSTIWLSFNSADRNKVDEETYLVMKNKHGSSDAVTEDARYKIIAIENEAPEYIKTTQVGLGKIYDLTGAETLDSIFASSAVTDVGSITNDLADYPPLNIYSGTDANKIDIVEETWNSSVVGDTNNDKGIFGRTINGKLKFRVVGNNGIKELTSSWRTISHYVQGTDNSGDNNIISIHWNKTFSPDDVNMAQRFHTLYSGDGGDADYNPTNLKYNLQFSENIIENKPEFDGKFFVKVDRDQKIVENIESASPLGQSLVPKGIYQLHYIESKHINQHEMSGGAQVNPNTGQQVVGWADFDGATADGTAWFGGAFVDFIQGVEGVYDDAFFDNASFYLNTPDANNFPMADTTGLTIDPDGTITFDAVADEDIAFSTGLPTLYGGDVEPEFTISSFAGWYPNPGSPESEITQFSPFGSCSSNYNEMTRSFWNNIYPEYRETIKTVGQVNGVDPSLTNTTGPVFLDATNMARMIIRTGPGFTQNASAAPDPPYNQQSFTYQDLDGNEITTASPADTINTGPYGAFEGGITGSSTEDTDPANKYWKPISVFHQGEAKVNGSTNVEQGTYGSMCMSYSGGWDESFMPLLFHELRNAHTYFQFVDDPTQTVYRTIGVFRASNGWGSDNTENWQYNWRGIGYNSDIDVIPPYTDYDDNNVTSGYDTANCNIYPQSATLNGFGQPKASLRHTQWVEFRKVSDANHQLLENKGIDVSEFDPRAYMHHDGRDSIGIRILQLTSDAGSITEQGEETDLELGACWETEPKESVDLDLYYEASSAIPMVLNEKNAFDYAPINSIITAGRTQSNSNVLEKVLFNSLYKNHKVGNIHFINGDATTINPNDVTGDEIEVTNPNQAIISILSTNANTGTTALHKGDISIGDTIYFNHKNGLITSAKVNNYWRPIGEGDTSTQGINIGGQSATPLPGDTAFSTFTDNDSLYGVSSGPKGFEIGWGGIAGGGYYPGTYQLAWGDYSGLWALNSNLPVVGSILFIVKTLGGTYAQFAGNDFDGGIYVHSVSSVGAPEGTSKIEFRKIDGSNANEYVINEILPLASNLSFSLTGSSGSGWDDIVQGNSWSGNGIQVTLGSPTGYYGIDVEIWKQPVQLGWHNCYSFGNGVESDRIRDDFNAPQLDNGVRVSTNLPSYGEENIHSGLIYSGIYNSTSQVNDLNEFNMSQKITKELNPSYGSIQRLRTRDTDVVVFTQDKVLKVLANKDALFNADGNPQLTATDRVLGTAIPFVGDYGISTDPESLAWDKYRMYFTDRQRGAVLRLSRDGLTPISDAGMTSWFRTNIKHSSDALGTFDSTTGDYNLSLKYFNNKSFNNKTISFNEKSRGWVSFKSFVPSSGHSVGGRYLTVKDNKIWEHHVDKDVSGSKVNRNSFYGTDYFSSVSILFNDNPSVVKSFRTVNYEGSKGKKVKGIPGSTIHSLSNIATENSSDLGEVVAGSYGNPFTNDLSVNKFGAPPINGNEESDDWSATYGKHGNYKEMINVDGWFVTMVSTDLDKAKARYFKEKEGKWFADIYGFSNIGAWESDSKANQSYYQKNINTSSFSTQGIGQVASVVYSGEEPADGNGDSPGDTDLCPSGSYLNEDGDCVEIVLLGCTDEEASNHDPDATWDDGSCNYNIIDCMDPLDPLYNPSASVPDASECQGYINGCMDETALNYNPLATQMGTLVTMMSGNSIFFQTFEYTNCNDASDNFYGCCNYTLIQDDIDPGGSDNEDDGTTPIETPASELCTQGGGLWITTASFSNNANGGSCFGCTQETNDNYVAQADFDCSVIAGSTTPFGTAATCIGEIDTALNAGTCQCCEVAQENDDYTIAGCTDPFACNYHPLANVSAVCPGLNCCEYDSCSCCGDTEASNYGYLSGLPVPPGGGDFEPSQCVNFVYDAPGCLYDESNFSYGCTDPNFTEFVGAGLASSPNFLPCPDGSCISQGGDCNCCETPNEVIIDDIIGCTDPTMFNYNVEANVSGICPGPGCCVPFNYGCTDPEAFNFNSDANTDDGSCEDVYYGCTDSSATNFSSAFNTDDGSCVYSDPIYGCMVNTFQLDGSATMLNYAPWADTPAGCDLRVCGCMDPNATNYNSSANTEYKTLYTYQEQYLGYAGAPLDDILENGDEYGVSVSFEKCEECVYPDGNNVSVDQITPGWNSNSSITEMVADTGPIPSGSNAVNDQPDTSWPLGNENDEE